MSKYTVVINGIKGLKHTIPILNYFNYIYILVDNYIYFLTVSAYNGPLLM